MKRKHRDGRTRHAFTDSIWRHAPVRLFSTSSKVAREKEYGSRQMRQTFMAYEFDEPFAALMSSSARHSATDFTLRKADSRVWTSDEVSTCDPSQGLDLRQW